MKQSTTTRAPWLVTWRAQRAGKGARARRRQRQPRQRRHPVALGSSVATLCHQQQSSSRGRLTMKDSNSMRVRAERQVDSVMPGSTSSLHQEASGALVDVSAQGQELD